MLIREIKGETDSTHIHRKEFKRINLFILSSPRPPQYSVSWVFRPLSSPLFLVCRSVSPALKNAHLFKYADAYKWRVRNTSNDSHVLGTVLHFVFICHPVLFSCTIRK